MSNIEGTLEEAHRRVSRSAGVIVSMLVRRRLSAAQLKMVSLDLEKALAIIQSTLTPENKPD